MIFGTNILRIGGRTSGLLLESICFWYLIARNNSVLQTENRKMRPFPLIILEILQRQKFSRISINETTLNTLIIQFIIFHPLASMLHPCEPHIVIRVKPAKQHFRSQFVVVIINQSEKRRNSVPAHFYCLISLYVCQSHTNKGSRKNGKSINTEQKVCFLVILFILLERFFFSANATNCQQ